MPKDDRNREFNDALMRGLCEDGAEEMIRRTHPPRSRNQAAQHAPRSREAAVPVAQSRVTIQNINVPGRTTRVDAAKYEAMRKALLKTLPAAPPGATQAEMFQRVRPHLPDALFPGGAKANWWVKTVQLDLEAKLLVRRIAGTPLRWVRSRES